MKKFNSILVSFLFVLVNQLRFSTQELLGPNQCNTNYICVDRSFCKGENTALTSSGLTFYCGDSNHIESKVCCEASASSDWTFTHSKDDDEEASVRAVDSAEEYNELLPESVSEPPIYIEVPEESPTSESVIPTAFPESTTEIPIVNNYQQAHPSHQNQQQFQQQFAHHQNFNQQHHNRYNPEYARNDFYNIRDVRKTTEEEPSKCECSCDKEKSENVVYVPVYMTPPAPERHHQQQPQYRFTRSQQYAQPPQMHHRPMQNIPAIVDHKKIGHVRN